MPLRIELTRNEIAADFEGFSERLAVYKEKLGKVDEVLVTVLCSDSRHDLPMFLDEKTAVLKMVKIGGGLPQKEEFIAALGTYKDWGLNPNARIRIIATQHGSTQEVEAALHSSPDSPITCGMREVYKGHSDLFGIIRDASLVLSPASYTYKRMIEGASIDTGIPEDLIALAAQSNFSDSILENAEAIRTHIRDYGLYDLINRTITVESGLFDHNKKNLYIRSQGKVETIKAGEQWSHPFQNPRDLIISVGPKAMSTPHELLLPQSVGNGNNNFKVSAMNDRFIGEALSQGWYAASHHAACKNGHSHPHASFTDLERIIFVVENADSERTVRYDLQRMNPTLKNAYHEIGAVYFLNVERERVTFAEV